MSKESQDALEIIGDILVVERIPDEDLVRKSGIIIPTQYSQKQVNAFTSNRPHWVRILAVGRGYYNEDGGDVPLNVLPGDIVLVPENSVKWFSVFGALEGYEADCIGLARESEIQIRFKGEAGYNQCFESLNRAIEKPVGERPPEPLI